MRFASSSKPSLTPLGWRLISLSEQKLYDLDAPVGARESGSALRRGVLVREAVKTAWSSIDEGRVGEMNDWHARGAMGLDVIGEDEEEEMDEEEEQKEERWFEDLLSSLGEEEVVPVPAEWVESEVQSVDDELYDVEGMEAYTIPLPPSPPVAPKVPSIAPAPAPASVPVVAPASVIERIAAPIDKLFTTEVDIVEVESADDDDDAADDVDFDDAASSCSDCSMCRSIAAHLDSALATSPTLKSLAPPSTPMTRPITPIDALSSASTPAFTYAGAVIPDIAECEDEDDLLLPPPLHRSWSSDSTDSMDDESMCRTPPPLDCEELEGEVFWERGAGEKAGGDGGFDDEVGYEDTGLRLVF